MGVVEPPGQVWAHPVLVVGRSRIAGRGLLAAGDELTVDYGTNSGADGFRMACACGAPGCRGEVPSDDWRRPDLRARYRGHGTPALQARIDRS